MIGLKGRLQIIAERLKDNKTMADIGTDHGFLPVYMVQQGLCERAVAADISAPSLEKAAQLCRQEDIENVDVRCGDGISVLRSGEVEGIAIAGMGGILITEILGKDPEHTASFKRFVLQPRSAAGELRRWLLLNGFVITAEDLVYEGKFIPQIITAVPRKWLGQSDDDVTAGHEIPDREICYEVPPWILKAQGPVADHLGRLIRREEHILEGLRRAEQRDQKLIDDTLWNIEYLENLRIEGGMK